MNKTMDYTSMPSLKHRALVKIAITLFYHDDIRELISKCPFIFKLVSRLDNTPCAQREKCIEMAKKELKKVEDEVLKYVIKLSLPDVLKEELLSFIEAIGWQLLKWRTYEEFPDAFKRNITKFYWTPQGTIDRKKSAEIYVKDEGIDIEIRYELACKYCLEDYIYTLWKQLKGWKNHNGSRNLKKIRTYKSPFVSFWSHSIKGKLQLLSRNIRKYSRDNSIFSDNTYFLYDISPYEYMFRISLEEGNVTSTSYFFQKLTLEEKEKLLIPSATFLAVFHGLSPRERDGECYADVLVFLLSKMNKEQQKEMFGYYPYSADREFSLKRSNELYSTLTKLYLEQEFIPIRKLYLRLPMNVIQCFMIWPRQTFFMKIAKSMFCCATQISAPFNPTMQYYVVLRKIASKIVNDSRDYNYRKLFAEFWFESHDSYKKPVIDNYTKDSLLSAVLKIEDEGNIRVILKHATISRKRKSLNG